MTLGISHLSPNFATLTACKNNWNISLSILGKKLENMANNVCGLVIIFIKRGCKSSVDLVKLSSTLNKTAQLVLTFSLSKWLRMLWSRKREILVMHELNQFHATKFYQSKVNLISTSQHLVTRQMSSQQCLHCQWKKVGIEFWFLLLQETEQREIPDFLSREDFHFFYWLIKSVLHPDHVISITFSCAIYWSILQLFYYKKFLFPLFSSLQLLMALSTFLWILTALYCS